MTDMEKTRIALIPAYKPDLKLTDLIIRLCGAHFSVVIVDDGSGEDYRGLFAAARRYAVVLTHEQNRGKGCALKTGLAYIERHCRENAAIVTLDADGQHCVNDAVRVVEAAKSAPGTLVLGCRNFREKGVPARSRFGNGLTRLVYRLATGVSVRDTQTGLRAFPASLVPLLLRVAGNRYEYEMNVLLECARRKVSIREVLISTVYFDGNTGSHFGAVKDSLRIYGGIFQFAASSFAGFVIDYGLYTLLTALTAGFGAISVPLANILARLVSAWVNYSINRKYVFRSMENAAQTAVQYFSLAALILAGNTVVLSALIGAGINKYPAKILTEILFFTMSWAAQKFIIFRKKIGQVEKEAEAK